ncbi:MAG: DUF481 domain-containing protein [Rhodothermales bacterium]|nr:DUF481 domain-containing protein [Rhodothermales bacterium]
MIISASQSAVGQVNVERLRKSADGAHFELGADFAFRSGNSEYIQLGVAGRFDYLSGKSHIFTIGNVGYAESNGSAYKNRAFIHQRFNYAFARLVTGELFGQIEQDEFVLLRLRLLGGAGVRLQLIDDDEYTIYLGTGLMVEHEELDESRLVSHPAVVTPIRSTNYLSIRIRISGSMDILNIIYLQPKLTDPADIRILSDGRLVFHVSEHVSWSNSILVRHDGIPPANLKTTDVDVKSGLTIRF